MESDFERILERLAAGEIDVDEARDRLRGIARTGDIARIDTRYGQRTGVPEVVEADGKLDDDLVVIAAELLDGTGRAILTGVGNDVRRRLEAAADESEWYERSNTLVLHDADFDAPEERGRIAVVTAGTSDIAVAERAVVIADEMGCAVDTLYDVGVSGIRRLFSELDRLDRCDCVVVAAGREGALATVVAGLIDAPIIGLPVSIGDGYGGDGEAALMGMLQSCTYLTTVNIDAGFVAGAQAAKIAR